MKELAILGPTASGKSALALELAQHHNGIILSIDSLSIYKEINIASAKPSTDELALVPHFGINEIYPNEAFSVSNFIHSYQAAKLYAHTEDKNLIIVGGTGFYLKTLLTGLSNIPDFSSETISKSKEMLLDLKACHKLLSEHDREYFENIAQNDRYRLEKMLLIFLETGMAPSVWFEKNPQKPIIEALPLFEIEVSREVLKERIIKRTHIMQKSGLIDEIAYLEHKYSRSPNAMGAIGIVEVLEYLDGFVSRTQMVENIITHTTQLAKRQQTYNRTQFESRSVLTTDEIFNAGARFFSS